MYTNTRARACTHNHVQEDSNLTIKIVNLVLVIRKYDKHTHTSTQKHTHTQAHTHTQSRTRIFKPINENIVTNHNSINRNIFVVKHKITHAHTYTNTYAHTHTHSHIKEDSNLPMMMR